METVLLDTDVVSYLLKGDSRAAAYVPLVTGNLVAISFMTVAELFQWAAVRHWGTKRAAHLAQTLTNYLVIPSDDGMCRLWGKIRADRQSVGLTISPQDAWIAATALRHHLPLITHNLSDYQGIAGLVVRTATLP
ncbi:MAG TPA: type II toxin-antitoxin system VapC family toxin [Ktedonobacterales bacterium]|nr:type II toxin-antitoxin system VapC family toxin [Ktedonobacterales bacterium]